MSCLGNKSVLLYNKDNLDRGILEQEYSYVLLKNIESIKEVLSEIDPIPTEDIDSLIGEFTYSAFQIFINENGELESIFQIDPTVPVFDSLALKSIKSAQFKALKENDKPIKYSLIIKYYLLKGDNIYPYINGFNSDPKEATRPVSDLKLIYKATPRYPRIARKKGIEGKVIVRVVINKKGNVVEAVILESPDRILSEATIEAAFKSKFSIKNNTGSEKRFTMTIPYDFRLRR